MNKDDVRIFFAFTDQKDEDGKFLKTQHALRRMQVTSWRPGAKLLDTTVVNTLDGKSVLLDHKFSEFHAWIIGPALERDKRLKEAGLISRPGRPKKKVDEATAETEQPAETTEDTDG